MKREHIILGVVVVIFGILLISANVPTDVFVDDYGTDYGAVGVWNFEEGTGYLTYDQSPYGHDGNFTPAPAPEQVIFGGHYSLLDDTLTEYNSLVGGQAWTDIIYWPYKLVSTDGVIKDLRVKLDDAPGVGTKYTFTLMVNIVPTALTFDIAGTDTTGSDTVHSIIVTGGDTVSLQCDPDGTPTPRYATWTSVFEGVNAKESLIMGASTEDFLSTTATEYGQVMCAQTLLSVTENNYREVVPTSGTIKNLYVQIYPDPGTAPDAFRFTLRKNGASQTLTVTITADDTTGSDLINTVDVVAGDILTMMFEPLNTPSEEWIETQWGMTFVADIDGESIVMGGATDDLDDTLTEYHYLTSWDYEDWVATESQRYQLGQDCAIKKLHILLSGSPYLGNKYDFTLRIAGADSNVVVTIAGADTTGNSGELEDTVADNEYVNLKVVPYSTPDVADAYWGFVCYTEPVILGIPIWTTGKFGSALNFTADVNIDMGSITTTFRTLECWIYLATTTEPLFTLDVGRDISVIAGTLTATGFVGTTTLYVDGEVSSTVTAETWHYIGVTSDTDEECTAFIIGRVGASYLDGKADQLRIYTEEKTRGEIRNHYLNSGHMYSGSVIVSDDFKILDTTLDERIGLDDSGLDMNHYYLLYSDFNHWMHFGLDPGMSDVTLNLIPAGFVTQDRHYHRVIFVVDTAPGVGKEVNVTLSNGADTMTVSLTGAETSGWTDVGAFDWDVSAETLILTYTQDAGGLATNGFITIKYHYKETP